MAQKFTKREKSWIVYDVGNSALVLLSTALIPIYFNSLAEGNALVAWSYAQTIASLVIALLMPFLGSLAELMISFPLDAYKEFMFRQFGPEWRMFGQILKDATFSVMSLIMVFSIGHHLTDQFNHDNPVLRANPVIQMHQVFMQAI